MTQGRHADPDLDDIQNPTASPLSPAEKILYRDGTPRKVRSARYASMPETP